MDFTPALPAPATAGNRSCPPRAAGDNDPRDSRVEESGALSFPGLLEQSRESVRKDESTPREENESAAGEKDSIRSATVAAGEDGEKPVSLVPHAKTAPVETAQGNVFPGIGQMIKVQLGAQSLTAAAAPGAETQVQGFPGKNAGAAVVDQPSLMDYQPTGGDGQVSPAITLPESGGDTGKEVAAGPGTPRPETGPAEGHLPVKETVPGLKSGPVPVGVPSGNVPVEMDAEEPAGRMAGPALAETLAASGTTRTPAGQKQKETTTQAEKTDPSRPIEIGTSGPEAIDGQAASPDHGEGTPADPEKLNAAAANAAFEAVREEPRESGDGDAGNGTAAVTDAKPAAAASRQAPVETAVPDLEKPGSAARPTGNGGHSFGRPDPAGPGHGIRRQVLQQLSSTLDGKVGTEKVTLQLNPEKLGLVEISFNAGGNDLDIVITADNHEAEQAIREGIRELAEGIAAKSGRWQQVDIRVDQRSQDPGKNENRQDSRREQGRRDDGGQGQGQHQQRNQSRGGAPDWASLREEG